MSDDSRGRMKRGRLGNGNEGGELVVSGELLAVIDVVRRWRTEKEDCFVLSCFGRFWVTYVRLHGTIGKAG